MLLYITWLHGCDGPYFYQANAENRQLRDMVANLQQTASQDQQSEEQQQLNQKQLAIITEQLLQVNKTKVGNKRNHFSLIYDISLSHLIFFSFYCLISLLFKVTKTKY